jgi:hypothetical protein
MLNSTREFEASVHVRGKPVTEVIHNGKTFIEGRRKTNYELYFRNNSPQQVLVVPSVDGLGAIDGLPAGKQSPGYVVGAWEDVTIPGWTVSGQTAAEFVFHSQNSSSEKDKTYVEQMDEDRQNQGAIGFMVFRKLPRPKVIRDGLWQSALPTQDSRWNDGSSTAMYSSVIGSSASVASAQNTEAALGTGFGDAVDFETHKVEFQREVDHCAVFVLFYDTIKNLSRVGVPVEQFARHHSEAYDSGPDPFPNSPEVAGYANAPKGWTGKSRKSRKSR